jgi:formamidopyrimidine-DNA glycosylase
VHLTVGGRTSAIVPSRQKKTAAVAGDVDMGDLENADVKPQKGRKRKATPEDDDATAAEVPAKKGGKRGTKKEQAGDVKLKDEEEPQVNGGAEETKLTNPKPKSKQTKATPSKAPALSTPSSGSRRSSRNQVK